MKPPILSLTTAGILAIILGLFLLGFSSRQSNQNDEFLESGLLRQGRVVSHQTPEKGSKFTLRLMTNVSPKVTGADMQIIEIEVKDGDFEKAPVGSLLNLVLIPGDPPRARLAGSVKRTTYRFGYVFASLCFFLAAFLIWLDWWSKKPRQAHDPKRPRKIKKAPSAPSLPSTMEKQIIKDPLLYQGAFEFSYSAEKTSVELKDGTLIRVSQYRPIAELPKVLADLDLLNVLRSAQSDWKLVDTIKTGHLALHHLLKEKHATSADQFFINGPYLGLLFRDETDNGQWHSFVRGIWKISSLSLILSKLTSGDPSLARKAALEILNHSDHQALATLAPNLPSIRGALKDTPRTGDISDDRRFITRAADIIESLANGNCYCQVYAKTSDSPHTLAKMEKFTLSPNKDNEKKSTLTCSRCQKSYTTTEHAGSYVPYYVWEEKK